MSKLLNIQPRISEKAYTASSELNMYIFEVPLTANKLQIKAAVEEQFGVSVTNVRTAITKGKRKSTPLKGRYPISGQRKNLKKAYVTLVPGDSLSVFEEA